MGTTAHYSWTKPTVGGDNNSWGDELNTDLDAIDAQMFANTALHPILLSSGSLSVAAAQQWITLPAGYTEYELLLEDIYPVTDAQELHLRVSTDNQATTISADVYSTTNDQVSAPGSGSTTGTANLSTIIPFLTMSNSATLGSKLRARIKQYRATGRFCMDWSGTFHQVILGTPTFVSVVGGGIVDTSGAAVTDIKLLMASGNIAKIGRWSLLGLPPG